MDSVTRASNNSEIVLALQRHPLDLSPTGVVNEPQKHAKARLGWRAAFITVAVLVLLAVGGNYVYSMYLDWADQRKRETVVASAKTAVQELSQVLQREQESLERLIDETRLARLLAHGDADRRVAAQTELTERHPDVLSARLLQPGVDGVDYSTSPPLSYAALDMLRRSETGGSAPLPEVHLFGSKDQSLAIVRRIESPEGKLAGHLLLGMDVSVLQKALDSVTSPGGYAEIRQSVSGSPPVILAKRGSSPTYLGEPALLTKVEGTAWMLSVWTDQRKSNGFVEMGTLGNWVGAAIAAFALFVAIGFYANLRQRKLAPKDRAESSGVEEVVVKDKIISNEARVDAESAGGGADVTKEPLDDMPVVEVSEVEFEAGVPSNTEAPTSKAGADVPASIFRAYDVRGVVGKTLTTDLVQQIGRAIGSEASARNQQVIVVGRDGRLSGPELMDALTRGLRSAGRDVIDVGCVPTPLLYFATHFLNTGSGVMLTGSHNPPDYNGLKIMLAGETLFGEGISALRTRIETGDLVGGTGNLQNMDVISEYIRRVSEDIPVAFGKSFKVVVDCGNGIAGVVAPKLFRALGHDVVELYCDVDGHFPNHHPDPSQPENLHDLIKAVKEHNADLGFAFDGDGDRLGVVDGKGDILWPDRQMMLYAKDVLSRNPGAEIIFDVKCSSRLRDMVEELGGKPVMWKTGHSFIKNKLRESGAPLAGEMSGHIFFKERWYGFDDAIYTGARLLEILMDYEESPTEIFAKLPGGVSTPELRVDMEEGQQIEFMHRLMQDNHFSEAEISTIDGLRVDYPDGWGLVRASNTTPSLVLRFEADDEQGLARIQEVFRSELLALEPGLSLPF